MSLRASVAVLILVPAVMAGLVVLEEEVAARECGNGFTRSSIAGEENRVKLSIIGQTSTCTSPETRKVALEPQPYFTHEIVCSTDPQAAAEGLCSATPCPTSFFALRTAHFPDGSARPAGFRCVTLDQAAASPGVSVAQVFAAVRRVRLPGGRIGVAPGVRGLANLESFFWVQGATQPPVELQVGGSRVQAAFRVLEYRWSFGEGRSLVTSGPGSPGLDSEVSVSFARRGVYRVGVTVVWVAQAWLDGRRVGEVNDLVSQTQTSYPVAELRTVLTG